MCELKDRTKVEHNIGDAWKIVRVGSLIKDDGVNCRCPECKSSVELSLFGYKKPHFRHVTSKMRVSKVEMARRANA